MATMKNFGLAGVSADVQWGKAGGRLDYTGGEFRARNAGNSAYVQFNVAQSPTSDNHAASKFYVDSVATGLLVKEAVRTATIAASEIETSYTYQSANDDNSTATPVIWLAAGTPGAVFDGVTLADGDRVLIDEATDQRGNGIFTFHTDADGSGNHGFKRTADADNTPGNEVAGGMIVFVAEGVSHGADQHVLISPTGAAVLGTDDLVFTVFSGASAFTGGDGINISGTTIELDLDELATNTILTTDELVFNDDPGGTPGNSKTTVANFLTDLDIVTIGGGGNALTASDGVTLSTNDIQLDIVGLADTATVGADEMVFEDNSASGTHIKRSVTNFLADHDIVNLGAFSSAHLISRTADDTYAEITVAASSATDELGIVITNGDGSASTIDVGLDITGLTSLGAAPAANDEMVIYDTSATQNKKVTVTNLASAIAATATDDAITDGDADTAIKVEESTDEDVIRFDVGDTPAGYGAVADIMTLAASGWTVAMGTANTATTGGAPINITSGTGNTTGAGGAINLTAGNGGATGTGGAITLTGGDGGATSGAGGAITLAGGSATDGAGGNVVISGADAVGAGNNDGGDVVISAGARTGTGATGIVDIQDPGGDSIARFQDVATSVNYWTFQGGADSAGDGTVTVGAAGTSTNIDMTFNVKGNGVLTVTGNASYETYVTADDDIPNKKYVDDAIGAVSTQTIVDGDTQITVGDSANEGTIDNTIEFTAGGTLVGTWDASALTVEAGVLELQDGSAAAPALTFENDTDTGLYSGASDELGLTQGGAVIATFAHDAGNTDDDYFVFTNGNGTAEVRIEAEGTGSDVDIRLVPKGSGQVYIGDAGAGLIQADDDYALTVKGGDSNASDAGDLILEGGDGTGGNASGDVVIRGGTGGAAEGVVWIHDSAENEVMKFSGVSSAVNYWDAQNSATGNGVQLSAAGDDTDIDIVLLPKGTGAISVTGTTNYEDNVTDDDDIPNKKYVDDAIAGGAVSGTTSSYKFTVDLSTDGNTDPGDSIPASATVMRVYVNVGTADASATLTVGTTGSPSAYAATTDTDPSATGLYVVDLFSTTVGALRAVVASTNGDVGATCDIIVEYKNN